MYNYIIKKGGKEKLNNGIKAHTKHCLSRGKDVGLTEKRGAYALFLVPKLPQKEKKGKPTPLFNHIYPLI